MLSRRRAGDGLRKNAGGFWPRPRQRPVSVVARRHGVAASLMFRWRRQAGIGGEKIAGNRTKASFVLVALPAPVAARAAMVEHSPELAPDHGLIEIELAGGGCG